MNDLISRQAAIDAIRAFFDEFNDNEKSIEELISEVPTVDTVKHGKWVLPRDEGCVTYDERAYAECSICGKKTFLGWRNKYCRNCGARMDGE